MIREGINEIFDELRDELTLTEKQKARFDTLQICVRVELKKLELFEAKLAKARQQMRGYLPDSKEEEESSPDDGRGQFLH